MNEAQSYPTGRPAAFTADEIRTRRSRLIALETAVLDHPEVGGDHLLNPGMPPGMTGGVTRLRDAAVLVPVVDRAPEATVLLTTRSAGLPAHAGQVAFPGGKIDRDDPSPLAAALREAFEEIGLESDTVEPLGYGAPYLTGSGYRIVPVVAVVPPDAALRPNPGEVDDIFEVPLRHLMSAANHVRGSRDWNGATRHFYAMPYGERYIWGVTAGIVRTLFERLYA